MSTSGTLAEERSEQATRGGGWQRGGGGGERKVRIIRRYIKPLLPPPSHIEWV